MQIKFTSKYSDTYLQTLRKKLSKYRVFSGPYFTVFSPNTGNYRPEKIPYLDTFNAVKCWAKGNKLSDTRCGRLNSKQWKFLL